ncbi:MAG TPA: FecR family protein, partial [Gammaproteobacteria bacterium]|nr:FecR family protein [Gammaproteobacteria bacterium]
MTQNRKLLFFILLCLFATSVALSQEGFQTEGGFEVQPTPATAATPPSSANPSASSIKDSKLQPAGQIVWVSGAVKATYPEQTPRILARGSMVYEKDTIVTDSSGSGQLAFTDNSMVTLNPGSTFVIEQYYFNQEKPEQGGQSVMNLLKGGFRAVTGFVAKAAPANYQVKTPVATIGVRGTDFQGSCPR